MSEKRFVKISTHKLGSMGLESTFVLVDTQTAASTICSPSPVMPAV